MSPPEPEPFAPRSASGRLVLRRRVDETILIGDDVQIRVAQVEPGAVKLEVRAPRDVPVWRAELANRDTAS